MRRTMKICVMALFAMFAFNLVANAQKWAYQADFNEGRACVKDKNGKWGYIDESGKVDDEKAAGKFLSWSLSADISFLDGGVGQFILQVNRWCEDYATADN